MKMKALMEFCDLNMGQSPNSETYNEENIGLPFFQGNADFGEVYPKVRIWCSSPVKVAAVGDILISVRAPIGAMNIANTPCCIGRGLAALSPNPDTCMREYLYYALQSRIDWLIAQGTGSTFKAIGRKTLEGTQIPAYSLDEQQIISDTLSKTDQLITKAKAQASLLDELVKSRFVEMFGEPFRCPKWKTEQLHVLAESISDGSNIDKQCYKKHDSVLFLRIQNVWFNELRLEDSVDISDVVNKNYFDTSLHKGDLLITKIGRYYTDDSSLGRVSVYLGEDDKANYSNNIMRVRLRDRVNSEFVNALMNLDDYNKYIRNVSVGGTDKRALSKKIIGELPIVVPPEQIQQQYVEFLHQVDKSKLAVKQSLEKLETLKKSLMQQYFG